MKSHTTIIIVIAIAACVGLFLIAGVICAGVFIVGVRSVDTAVSPEVDELFRAIENDTFAATCHGVSIMHSFQLALGILG